VPSSDPECVSVSLGTIELVAVSTRVFLPVYRGGDYSVSRLSVQILKDEYLFILGLQKYA